VISTKPEIALECAKRLGIALTGAKPGTEEYRFWESRIRLAALHSQRGMRKPTIYEDLKYFLGREPTHRELCDKVKAILEKRGIGLKSQH
jgi:hypothetical protein